MTQPQSNLLTDLASDDWSARRGAEDGLRAMGSSAVPQLIEGLRSSNATVRWGAARVLGQIADASSAPALVDALEDEDGGVRWLAAEGLVKIGQASVIPILRKLLTRADSPWVQEGAHHALRGLGTPTISPVIRALEGSFKGTTVPVAANEALSALERS